MTGPIRPLIWTIGKAREHGVRLDHTWRPVFVCAKCTNPIDSLPCPHCQEPAPK